MPEPVVIISPATQSAGPAVPHPSHTQAGTVDAAPDEADEVAAGPSLMRRILGILLAILRRVAKAFASVLVYVIREYPRHAIAAGASVVILGGILYSQSGSGTGRSGVTNAIKGNPSAKPDDSKSPGTDAGGDVAASPKPPDTQKSAGSDAPATTAADPPIPPAPESQQTKTPQNEVASQAVLPAPTADSTQHDATQPSALAQAAAAEKPPAGSASGQAPAAPNPDPADAPLPAPASDSAKATLLANAGPPAPAGDQAAKSKTTTDVPSDLWLPEAAPKPAANETAKSAKTGETAVAAAPTGESKPPENPKPAVETPSKVVEPSPKAIAGSTTLSESSPSGEIPATHTPPVTNPGPATESMAPGQTKDQSMAPGEIKDIEPSVNAPSTQDEEGRRKNPAAGEQPPESKAVDSSAPPPAPAAPVPSSADEKTNRDGTGPDVRSAPAAAAPEPAPAHEDPITGISPATERATETGSAVRSETVAPSAPAAEPKVDPSASNKASRPGWIVIANSGKVPVDPTESSSPGSGESGSVDGSEPAISTRDLRAHAARDVAFEPEPSQLGSNRTSAVASARRESHTGSGADKAAQPRAASHMERVETTEHLVERGENYWTISRQYWGSGRYYRALWKANEAKHPDIKDLRVGDVIIVPAVEDLDPNEILPASTDARSVSLAAAGTSRQLNQRVRRADDHDRAAEQRFKGKSASPSEIFDDSGDEIESRTSARPRPGGRAPGPPVYRVRPYDTLRSIARDTLGTSRRADEILDLNRGLIDDPSQLVVGQVLELPEDARTSIRRPARSR